MSSESGSFDSPVAIGEVLAGKYRIDRVLGQGGMGVVVAATHLHLRQRVAIKFLLDRARGDVVARFLREARAAARLKSEHVARVIDVGELPNGSPFMVMEFLEGSDLEGVLAQRGPLPIDEAVAHVLQACEAIAEAHAAGIVHRDLKPANLFLTRTPDGSGSVKVLDFGISKDTNEDVSEASPSLTRTTAVLGSPSYMAPEQMRSTRDANARADIWSLGIILYELITGAVPFVAESFVELALKVISDEPPPPSSHRADLPPALEAAILRCIRKDPAERFASVTELALAIAPFAPAAAGYADRIARVQGFAARTGDSMLPIVPLAEPSLGTTQLLDAKNARSTAARAQAGTISATGWSGTGAPPKASGRWTRATMLLLGGVVGGVGVLGGAAFALRGDDPPAQSPAAVGAGSSPSEKRPMKLPPPAADPPPPSPTDEAPDAAPEAAEPKAAEETPDQAEAEATPAAIPSATPPTSAPARRPKPQQAESPEAKSPSAPARQQPAKPAPPTPAPKKNPLDIDIQ